MRKAYPSDLSDDQWALIEPLIPNTVEIGASHSLLLPWGYSGPKQQGGYDSHATRTMHAAAR